MDKREKEQHGKTPDQDPPANVAPPGASFDTEEGRAAQGMRPDIGAGPSDQEKQRDQPPETKPEPKTPVKP